MSSVLSRPRLQVKRLGRVGYEATYHAMREQTLARDSDSPDELWLLEHDPVFTLGQAGKPEHLLRETGIALVHTDRGGQITYHGPGQLVAYVLLDLARHGLKIRQLVTLLEQAAIDLCAEYGISAERLAGAPGVYVAGAKIAALGLRVRGGCSYHGLSLNVNMDLSPFTAINPCGYSGMPVTQLADFDVADDVATVGNKLTAQLERLLLHTHKVEQHD